MKRSRQRNLLALCLASALAVPALPLSAAPKTIPPPAAKEPTRFCNLKMSFSTTLAFAGRSSEPTLSMPEGTTLENFS
jgi:hypothetical protein